MGQSLNISSQGHVDLPNSCVLIPADVPVVKSLVFSGKAPVDNFCSLKDKVHVYCEQNDVWDCMLNQVGSGHEFTTG